MNDQATFDRIKKIIDENQVLLFMKGSPMFPQCGFSSAVVQALFETGVKFKGVDVLTDPEIRDGIKAFSQWPTLPQLYIKGDFIGGCDIVREMFESGELKKLLEEKGVEFAKK